ncbi:MAG: hypothetical protein AAB787_02105 [Patescibacteria group bacterium]
MDSFVKADVFFFISSIAILALTIGLSILIFYLVRILNDVKHISKSIRERSDVILGDVDRLRESIRNGGWIKAIWGLFHSDNRAQAEQSSYDGNSKKVAKPKRAKTKK